MTSALTQLIDALDAMPTTSLRIISTGLTRVVDALGMTGEPAGMFFEEGLDSEPQLKRRRRSK
jgi:hypothetical protein